jgi:hypothetical protein
MSHFGYWRNFVANAGKIREETEEKRSAFKMERVDWPPVFFG